MLPRRVRTGHLVSAPSTNDQQLLPSVLPSRSDSHRSLAIARRALAAALLWKREREPYFRQQAHEQLANFTIRWLNTTANGTLAYDRSGFFGWMLPLAYAELRSDGAAPPWNASFTTLFKRACHSFMAPQIVSEDGTQGDVPGCDPSAAHAGTYGCGGGDGYWEIGNWNKGFNHWADSVAMLHAFGDEWDAAPGVNGMYETYNARMHDSWVAQHPYEENSCNYNGISYFCAATIGYMLNETRTILPASVRDVFLVRKTPSFELFHTKNDQFTKTGSGQTQEKLRR